MSEAHRSDSALRQFATRISLLVAVGLVAVKFVAWLATGSVALLASAVDAFVDAGSSLVTFFGVRFAGQPPDWDHRFGHGKGEAIAGFTQATFLAGAGVVLAVQSVERFVFPVSFRALNVGIVVILCSMIAAAALVALQTWVVSETGSTAIAADRAHYMSDIALNAGVLVALGITKASGWERADPIIAFLIAAYMMWNAHRIGHSVLTQLLDRELPESDRLHIRNVVLACPGVRAVHDLRTRNAGDRTFVEFHLEVDGQLSVAQGHAIGDAAEAAVEHLLPGTVEVTAHLEPFGINDERLDDRVNETATG